MDRSARNRSSRRESVFLRPDHLDLKPRARSREGSLSGSEANLLDDPVSDVQSTRRSRMMKNSSGGSMSMSIPDGSKRRVVSDAYRRTRSVSRECMFTHPTMEMDEMSTASFSSSITSVGTTNFLEIPGPKPVWELKTSLSNPSISPSKIPGQPISGAVPIQHKQYYMVPGSKMDQAHSCPLVSGDTLDKGRQCRHCCVIQ